MLDIICEYEDYLSRVRQASGNTVSSYIRDIRQFSDWLERAEKKLRKFYENRQT